MRRLALIFVSMLGLGAVLASSAPGDGGPTDDYLVRAYFDNAGFLVENEEVRVAGANVGTIDSVDVARPGEPVKADGSDDPGKAVVVLRISDSAFQDFRADASCIIRPQSLLGEKFVECKPTEPRSSLGEAPPELEVIADGQPGEGQRFLPLENNGKAVDLDLVNNITREPELDRFRLIINDLGAGLAARGETLGQVIERANPALQETDKVLKILAEQNKELARLAVDSDAILTPLSRERDSVAGFIKTATTTGEAAAERRDAIEQGFIEFPNALRELESTMVELRRFSEEATPVAADLNVAAPALAGATEALAPFARAGTPALVTLGDATEAAGPDLAASAPVIQDLGKLGEANTPAAKNLNALLKSLRKTGGTDLLYKTILNFGNTVNGFDDYGHFVRGAIQINNCTTLVVAVVNFDCRATWLGASSSAATAADPTSPEDVVSSPREKQQTGKRTGSSKLASGQRQAASDLLDFLTGDGE
ncbi:MAG: MCE family protein [Thermoleophilia bacterium]|nr:MCE family protein [Thermoleophilia bacterium]